MNKGACQEKNASREEKKDKSQAMWNEAIKDQEQELQVAEKRVAGLKAAIRTFQSNRDMGCQWPGLDLHGE
ncbi:MAG: hypothetical protein ACLQVM_26545 [Terriglobia bacterium]